MAHPAAGDERAGGRLLGGPAAAPLRELRAELVDLARELTAHLLAEGLELAFVALRDAAPLGLELGALAGEPVALLAGAARGVVRLAQPRGELLPQAFHLGEQPAIVAP